MDFPQTNKRKQDLNDSFGENAKLLEERLKDINWRYFGKAYGIGFAILLASIFLLIVIVRFAFVIF